MSAVTGLPHSDFPLIALAEYLSISRFVTTRPLRCKNKILAYAGANQNFATWIKYRKPKNMVAQYFTRILNRFETEHDCTVFTCYVSSGNNVFCGKLARLEDELARAHGAGQGYEFVDVVTMFRWFLPDRLRNRSLVLPTDPPGRVCRIMQFVEKRLVRSIPSEVKKQTRMLLLGKGTTNWAQTIAAALKEGCSAIKLLPWPSETVDPKGPKRQYIGHWDCVVFSVPKLMIDVEYVVSVIESTSPSVVVCGSHPLKAFPTVLSGSLKEGRTTWSWEMNMASLGCPQSRLRTLRISGSG